MKMMMIMKFDFYSVKVIKATSTEFTEVQNTF